MSSARCRFRAVPNQPDFPRLERDVLDRWSHERTFERSVTQREGGQPYVFYDGPPFATGLPHYGHILTSFIKDVVPRYFTMRGCHVPRRWGWDCHGLPVEFEVEKLLNFQSRSDVLNYGVGKFNDECRALVLRYAEEWRQSIERLGRWVDFDNAYRTMDADYIESVLWCFKRLHDLGLIYEGSKVVPYCFRCQTALSNFEARLDDAYRSRQDPAVTVRFRLADAPDQSVLAWTTTPWTLTSNVALAVAEDLEYLRMEKGGESVWLATAARERYSKYLENHRQVEGVRGKDLAGRRYQPILPYYADLEGAFVVTASAHVSADDGTGVVHLAPAFGEEDNAICKGLGIRGPNPVQDDGTFDANVVDFAGQNVLAANRGLIRRLESSGALFAEQTYEHSYPHCWRCDSPLLYRAIPSWFVRVSAFKERLLAANQNIRWVPEHLRDGRFGHWLEGARDWAVSRSRFWGAPIPVWRCTECGSDTVIGSAKELRDLSGSDIKDWHRPAIDKISFPCPSCGAVAQRVPDILDCWFESGSMPYAQAHYPFKNKESFEAAFPGDFIVEYIAQTRGWFYTMVVLSSALFDSPPFKNVVCHGVILGSDGRKMSKRLKNYPDPMELVERHGSDALRLALLSSAAASGNDIRFAPESVRDAVRRVLLPFWNCLHLFTSYAEIDNFTPSAGFSAATRLDRYLLAETEALRGAIEDAMDAYDFSRAYNEIEAYVVLLSTWYVRLTKARLWRSGMDTDKRAAFQTLYAAMSVFARIVAPFLPFLAESTQAALGQKRSVHLTDWPQAQTDWADPAIVHEMRQLREAVRLARHIREENGVKHRHPVPQIWLGGVPEEVIGANMALLRSELNAKTVARLESPEHYVLQEVVLDYSRLGRRLRGKMKPVADAVSRGRFVAESTGELRVLDETVAANEYSMRYRSKANELGVAVAGTIIVLMDLNRDDALVCEGHARDLNRALQDLRKRARLAYSDRVKISIDGDPAFLDGLKGHISWLSGQLLADVILYGPMDDGELVTSDDVVVGGHSLTLSLRPSSAGKKAGPA